MTTEAKNATAKRLLGIVEGGAIRPAQAFVPRGERPGVWCSSLQDWEPTATKAILDPNVRRGARRSSWNTSRARTRHRRLVVTESRRPRIESPR